MLTFLRSLFRAYTWVEPEPFRRAEQFGLDEQPCSTAIRRTPAFARV